MAKKWTPEDSKEFRLRATGDVQRASMELDRLTKQNALLRKRWRLAIAARKAREAYWSKRWENLKGAVGIVLGSRLRFELWETFDRLEANDGRGKDE